MKICYLGLGSNLRTPQRQLRIALQLLRKLPKSLLHKSSQIYKSRSILRSQPNYRNLVVALHTCLPPHRLLHYTQRIEKKMKRTHKKRWGSRTIDIDMLLYDQYTLDQPALKIPHPEMIHRDFVLTPLLEISPNIQLPQGKKLVSYLADCQSHLI